MPGAFDSLAHPGHAEDVCLPQDMLAEVLRHLSQQERLHHAPLVCKLLRAAAYKATADASINLVAAAPDGSLARFRAWLGRGGSMFIQSLTIKCSPKALYVLPNAPQPPVHLPWSDLSALRSLHLHGVQLHPGDLQQHMSWLTSLTLNRVANTSCLLQHLPAGLRQLVVRSDGQHRSTISSISSSSSWEQQAAWKAVGQLRHLTSLLLDRCCKTDASLQLLTGLQQLQRLVLWHNRLTKPWPALARLAALTHLDLLSSDPLRIGGSSLGSSSSGWLGLVKLQELRCGSHVLLEDPASPGCLALPPNLVKLEGCGWHFASPAAAQVLLECTLPVLPLQQLKLLCCEFPAGLQPGAFAALGRLAALSSLNLSGCMVPHGACSNEGLFKAGAMPRLQELLLHALSYSPVDGSHPAVSPARTAAAGSCLASLSAACPALQRLDIRGMLAVELGGLTALTRLQHLSKVEVDVHWYGVLDEAAAAAMQQLGRKAPSATAPAAVASSAAVVGSGAAVGVDSAGEATAAGTAAAVDSQQG